MPKTDKKWSWPAALIAISISLYLAGAGMEKGAVGYEKIMGVKHSQTQEELSSKKNG